MIQRIVLTGLMLSSSVGFGTVLQITPSTELSLGRGADSLTEQAYDQCITYDLEKFEDGSSTLKPGEFTANQLPVKIEQITSYEQMSEYSATSISASVSYSFVSASMSYSSSQGSNMFSDQASVGMDVSADYGRWFITNVQIKPEYASLARDEFYKKCGKEYVAGYRLGQGVRVKMTVSASATSSYSQMSTAVGVAVSTGEIGVGVAGAFQNAASSLMQASSLQVDMTAYGAGDLNKINTLIATENDAVKFRNTLATYVSGLDAKNAVRTHYITRAYYPEDNTFDPMLIQVQRQTVQSLYSDFAMLTQNKQRLEAATRNGKLRQFLGDICQKKPTECATYVTTMEHEQNWITDQIAKLDDLSKQCIQATKTSDCKTYAEVNIMQDQLENIIWPVNYRYQLMQAYLDDIKKR
jgi:hypothetical protein